MKDINIADAIISRLHEAYGIEEKRGSLKLLGMKLGISGSVISGWRERGVPDDKISRARIDTGYLESWIKTGNGPKEKILAREDGVSYGQPIDWDLLEEVLILIRDVEVTYDLKVRKEKIGDLVKYIYYEYERGNAPSRERLVEVVRLAA